MNRIMRKRIIAAAAAVLLLLTGCSSYQAGTTENNVYRNEAAGFQITTPEDYVCYDSDSYNACSYYMSNYLQANARGAEKSWTCEYAAKSLGCEVLVCSEENVNNDTLEAYAERVGDQWELDLLDLTVQDITEVRLGGKIFRKVSLSTGVCDINIYIRQVDDSFVYIHHVVIHHEWLEGQEDALLDNISGIG